MLRNNRKSRISLVLSPYNPWKHHTTVVSDIARHFKKQESITYHSIFTILYYILDPAFTFNRVLTLNKFIAFD